MSDLVRNPEDRFSRVAAHMVKKKVQLKTINQMTLVYAQQPVQV